MSVKLPCGCKDVTMCPTHEAAWWARHYEALRTHAAEQKAADPAYVSRLKGAALAIPVDNSDLL